MDLELREKVAVIVGGSRGIGHAAARSATRNWCRCRAVYRSTETLAVVGANGAGKTTMLRTISGLLRPRRGEVRFEGELIDRLPCHRVVERGGGAVWETFNDRLGSASREPQRSIPSRD